MKQQTKKRENKDNERITKSQAREDKIKQQRAANQEEKQVLENKYDENLKYSDDSSDEEVLLRVGNVPQKWYDMYDHKGYSVDGKSVTKMVEGDELQKFIERQEDPLWWAKITDYLNNKSVKLSVADLELLQRVRKGKMADSSIDPFEDWDLDFGDKGFEHPLSAAPEPKRRFVQSKWERLKVSKFIQALKKGWMKTLAEKKKEQEEKEKEQDKVWDIWQDESIVTWKPRRMPKPITAPKRDLPGHAESYNPAPEYLFDEKEKKEWQDADPEDRQSNFLPQMFDALRKVPLYEELIKEHFERCLDLYMCPRLLKKKANISDPSKLIPELPSPNDLKPFPTRLSVEYCFHTTCVRSISISPNGLFLASGDESGNLIVWNLQSSRIMKKFTMPNKVIDVVQWCPNQQTCVIAVANENQVHLVQPEVYSRQINQSTKDMLALTQKTYQVEHHTVKDSVCEWQFGDMVSLTFKNVISKISWHSKGDYLATVAHNIQSTNQVIIHSISKSTSQRPFSTTKGIIQDVSFHPTKPHFFAATHTTVFQYNLQKQSIVNKYQSGAKWISSISIHPKGDHFILGTYDKKVLWFDMDMSGEKPYKSMKYHEKAIRDINYSQKYPLFASASDDGSVNVFYGMVYSDLLSDALVVPVKVLKAHESQTSTGLGTMSCTWHPSQPWIVTAGADGKIKMWV